MRGLFRSVILILGILELYWLLPPRFTPSANPKPGVRVGAIHVRSPHPVTAEKLELLTTKAKQSGIDFIVIADPKSSHARSIGLEGNYDGVDVYVELEAHLTAGHALVFYSHTQARELSDEALSKVAWRHFLGTDPRPGMFLIVSHPDSRTHPWNRLDRFSEGTELLNVDTLVHNQQEAAPLSLLMSALIFPFNNFLATLRTIQIPQKNLESWDAINTISPGHFGVASQEITSESFLPQWVAPEWSFSRAILPAALNAVLLDAPPAENFEARRQQTYEALMRGRSAMFFPLRFARYAAHWGLNCPGKNYAPGDRAPSALSGCKFETELDPELLKLKPILRLVRDGKVVTQWEKPLQSVVSYNLPPESTGAYRLEIGIEARTPLGLLYNREAPYAFYNPIYVR
jgi:hypothetical protein